MFLVNLKNSQLKSALARTAAKEKSRRNYFIYLLLSVPPLFAFFVL